MSKESMRRSVLIVDDEKDIVDFLQYNIEKRVTSFTLLKTEKKPLKWRV
jgi:DNA-binding NtrC family response regulator